MEILLLTIGLVVGAATGYFVAASRTAALKERAAMLAGMAQAAEEKAQQEIATVKEELRSDHELDLKRLAQQHQEALAAQQERYDETMARVTEQLKNATSDMLKQRQEEFARSSNRDLGQIVNPLRDTIESMRKAMDDNTVKQTSMTTAMTTSMENMMKHSLAAQQSADELARVFKFGNKIQGNWGETVLDELLKSQGLTCGVHYDTQATMHTGNGDTLMPDVILHLDQNRDVIIDSKVSLSAFIDYVNSDDENERNRCLKAHVDSIKKHYKELSKKDYTSYIKPPKVKMNYVIMFVPHSGALWTALNAQPDLWRKAMEQNVFIADEQTLYAALRIVDLTWTQIVQAQSHEKVYELANEMLARVGLFWKEYEEMGKSLAKAQTAYDKAKKKITDGGKSINTTARQLVQMGAKANVNNPLPPIEQE